MNQYKIIQNAVKITEEDKETFLVSANRHDFVSYQFKDGSSFFIDGGKEYLRRGGTFLKDPRIENYSLDENHSFLVIKEKLLWGTRGKDGQGELTYKPIKDLDKDHLIAILETQNVSELYKEVINYWIYD